MNTSSSIDLIQQHNDQFRRAIPSDQMQLSPGIRSLDPEAIQQVENAVRNYQNFEADDAHDFGVIHHGFLKIYWKIQREPQILKLFLSHGD